MASWSAVSRSQVVHEADGCDLVDVDVFPTGGEQVLEGYFGDDGVPGFLSDVGSGVAACRRDHDVRVFSLSINVEAPTGLDRYSDEARMLDQTADDNDAIIVISAGTSPRTPPGRNGRASRRRHWHS